MSIWFPWKAMTKIQVSKFHGCGNDFILTTYEAVKDLDIPKFVQKVCDRHSGIGADGAIFVKENPCEMVYYNQDGSRAPMCGNGIRCFAAYCYEEGFHRESELVVQTLAGEKIVHRIGEAPFLVKVDMGYADYDPKKVGTENALWNETVKIDGQDVTLSTFFMSTVHTVLFSEKADTIENRALGKKICHDALFAEQTNVNFVEVMDENNLKVLTYERGCGITLACGTGVCASVLTSYKLGKCSNHVDVHLEKGIIHIDIDEDERVYMTGPAECVMKGVYYYD